MVYIDNNKMLYKHTVDVSALRMAHGWITLYRSRMTK